MTDEPELIPTHAHRALLLIAKLEAVKTHPTVEQVELFATSTGPAPAQYSSKLAATLAVSLGMLGEQKLVREAEPVVDWLGRMGWTEKKSGRVLLTDYGRAFLRALKAQPITKSPESSTAVLLDPSNPFVYSELTGHIATMGAGMLVDPYFKADSVQWLIDATRLTRVLMSDQKSQAQEVAQVQTALHGLQGTPAGDRIEVRASGSAELHDRLVVAEDMSLMLLGTSLTGVGQHLSSLVPLSSIAGDALRKHVERLWKSATPVNPAGLRRATP